MAPDEYVDEHCDECRSPLVQLDGEWFCPECNDGEHFHLVPDTDDFAL
jgi:uncharacterized Zn finger protein (UPF0148 family)